MFQTIAHQLAAAQLHSREEWQLQYAKWIRQGEAEGLKGLFRSLEASELSWQRPYRNVPMADRMRRRLRDLHSLWKPTADQQPLARPSLQQEAQAQIGRVAMTSQRSCFRLHHHRHSHHYSRSSK